MNPLNITVLGATGMVGSRLVTEAASRGHRVTAASRHPRSSDAAMSLRVDAFSPTHLDAALTNADTAILAIKAVPGTVKAHTAMTTTVLDTARRHGVRLLVIGGAGPLRSPDDPGPDPRVVDTLTPAMSRGRKVVFHHAPEDLLGAVQA